MVFIFAQPYPFMALGLHVFILGAFSAFYNIVFFTHPAHAGTVVANSFIARLAAILIFVKATITKIDTKIAVLYTKFAQRRTAVWAFRPRFGLVTVD